MRSPSLGAQFELGPVVITNSISDYVATAHGGEELYTVLRGSLTRTVRRTMRWWRTITGISGCTASTPRQRADLCHPRRQRHDRAPSVGILRGRAMFMIYLPRNFRVDDRHDVRINLTPARL